MVAARTNLSEFDPVQFVVDTLPNMDQWHFPFDALTHGIAGVTDWLREDFPEIPDYLSPETSMNYPVEFTANYGPINYPLIEENIFQNKENISPEEKVFQTLESKPVIQSDFSLRATLEAAPLVVPTIEPDFIFPEPNRWTSPPQSVSPLHQQWAFVANPVHIETPPYTPVVYSNPPPRPPPRKPLTPKQNKPKIEEVCSNCQTKESPMWRWNAKGDRECNACNLYEQHNKRKRPPERWGAKPIQRRRRNPKTIGANRNDKPY